MFTLSVRIKPHGGGKLREARPVLRRWEECRSPVSRILSAPLARGCTVISLTPPERSAPLTRDATSTRRVTGGPPFPCYVLHHAGFAVPPWLPLARWALTPPFHPYLCPCGPSAVCFLLHFPSGSLATAVPCFHKARCPMVSGLSSSTLARSCDRPGSGVATVVRIGGRCQGKLGLMVKKSGRASEVKRTRSVGRRVVEPMGRQWVVEFLSPLTSHGPGRCGDRPSLVSPSCGRLVLSCRW